MAKPTAKAVHHLLKVLRGVRVSQVGLSEVTLHGHIAQALTTAGIEYRREFVFAKGCRADFWVEPGIVIEVKKKRPDRARLEVQLSKYASVDKVGCLVLMLEKSITVPSPWEGVPLHIVSMNAAWGISI